MTVLVTMVIAVKTRVLLIASSSVEFDVNIFRKFSRPTKLTSDEKRFQLVNE